MVYSLTPFEQWVFVCCIVSGFDVYVKAKFVIFTIDVFILSWKLICLEPLDYNIGNSCMNERITKYF